MKKKIYKLLKKIFSNFWVRLIGLIVVITGIFALAGAFESFGTLWMAIKDFITSGDTISLVVVTAASLIIASFVIRGTRFLEESMKVEDDHHKIICMYSEHAKKEPSPGKNFDTKDGAFMYLSSVPTKRKKPKNPEKDNHSGAHDLREEDIKAYMNGKLYIPSVNVYANIAGDTQVDIADSPDKFELPRFVRDNALALMEAHKGSSFSNNTTIRLNDVSYEGNKLTLFTERSQYFDMLITNRCMDYKLNDLVSLRDVYESNKAVSPLSESQLGNQIGINGLIFTNDGYLLIEKRGYRKTTWKNKFAQPISLAMKKETVKDFLVNGVIKVDDDNGHKTVTEEEKIKLAEDVFKKIILKTIKDNFGITKNDIVEFSLAKNFFGIARDLLEGGKPNMYFYVTVNMTAQEFDAFLEKKAERASNGEKPTEEDPLPKLPNDKLDSDYYLIHYTNISVNYRYELSVKARDVVFVKRLFSPRVKKITAKLDGAYYRHKRRVNGSIKRECGEALLACLCYAEMCKDRLGK